MTPKPTFISHDDPDLESECSLETSLQVPGHGEVALFLLVTKYVQYPLLWSLGQLQLVANGMVHCPEGQTSVACNDTNAHGVILTQKCMYRTLQFSSQRCQQKQTCGTTDTQCSHPGHELHGFSGAQHGLQQLSRLGFLTALPQLSA